jgi:(S)-citramalyl-CoA lyase
MSDAALKPTRSRLFTPATRPDRFAKAAASGADVAILDLEDSVAPSDKDRARDIALDFLKTRKAEGAKHALRINGLDKRAGLRDLEALIESGATADYLVLPKTETAGHLLILDRLLTAASPETKLVGIVESVRGLAAIEAIASATPRLVGLMLGAADMAQISAPLRRGSRSPSPVPGWFLPARWPA